MEETTFQENERLYLSQEAQGFLKETPKGYFLSILGFIGIGLWWCCTFIENILAISGLSGTRKLMGVLKQDFISGLHLYSFTIFLSYLLYYLFKFSSKLKKAFKSNITTFDYLKITFINYWNFTGNL
jgi:hypothetical protein